jgi:hypothetical protein
MNLLLVKFVVLTLSPFIFPGQKICDLLSITLNTCQVVCFDNAMQHIPEMVVCVTVCLDHYHSV